MRTCLLFSIMLCCLTASGQNTILDLSFGNNGKVTVDPGYVSSAKIEAVAIQPDGKIVVCSYDLNRSGNNRDAVIQLRRFTVDGHFDTSFGNSGEVEMAIYPTYASMIPAGQMSLAIQPDGKIKCSGFSYYNRIHAIVSVNSDGTPDLDFGTSGVLITAAPENSYAAFFPNSEKFVIASTVVSSETKADFKVSVYNSNGSPDATFGINGTVHESIGLSLTAPPFTTPANFNSTDYVTLVTVQPDGKIMVGGLTDANAPYTTDNYQSDENNFALLRLNPDGTKDQTFGNNGVVITDFGHNDNLVTVVFTADNAIIAGGTAYYNPGRKHIVAKYNQSGTLDPTFGTGGKIIGAHDLEFLSAMLLMEDGKIVTGGSVWYGNTNLYALRRFNENGSLDESFGTNGKIEDAFGPVSSMITCLATHGNSLIAAGYKYSPYYVPAMAKYIINTLGINTLKTINSLIVSPNPFVHTVEVKFELPQHQELAFELFDINGRKTVTLLSTHPFSLGANSVKLDLPNTLSKGIYFLHISNGSSSTILKLLK